jgi:hypothetical protein
MTPEEVRQVQFHAQQIAKILYCDTDPASIQTLGAIETVVRQKMLESVSPEIGVFLSKTSLKQQPEDPASSKQRSGRSRSQKNKLEN